MTSKSKKLSMTPVISKTPVNQLQLDSSKVSTNTIKVSTNSSKVSTNSSTAFNTNTTATSIVKKKKDVSKNTKKTISRDEIVMDAVVKIEKSIKDKNPMGIKVSKKTATDKLTKQTRVTKQSKKDKPTNTTTNTNNTPNNTSDKPTNTNNTDKSTTKTIDTSTNNTTKSEVKLWDSFLSAFNSNDPLIISDEVHNVNNLNTTITNNGFEILPFPDTPFESNKNKINISLEPEQKFKPNVKTTTCNNCGGHLYVENYILVCKECGVETQNSSNITEEDYSTSAITDCNVNSNGFIAMKMSGVGAYGVQRSLLKTCANYPKYRKINTLIEMQIWNYTNDKKQHIPKNVIQEANDMFASIKDNGYVFRKDGKKGVLSACLYYACYNNGISKTPSEIAQFSSIEEKFHSLGDRILHDLNERGVIEIPIKVSPIIDYIDRYMELLDINKKYRAFVVELIFRAEKKRIHILHDSKSNTKCVGAIYMLVNRIPELRKKITKEMIEQQCGISKTTFIRYYTMLCQYYKKIKKVFKRHQIPMPVTWKNK